MEEEEDVRSLHTTAAKFHWVLYSQPALDMKNENLVENDVTEYLLFYSML
jgi:hypothetical protein